MATWADIRAAVASLPGVEETAWRDQPMFQVGSKGFVQTWRGRVIMKLDRGRQELLFEARPEVFSPYVAGALRWAYVDIAALEPAEAQALAREAWAQVVPSGSAAPTAHRPPRPPPAAPPAGRRPGSATCGAPRPGA